MIGKIVGLLAFVVVCCNAQKTPIVVYYESLCPDSQKFITEQLYPTMNGEHNLAKALDIQLIPYGISTHHTQGSEVRFVCHHGPNECYGNKLQSCAILHIQVDSFQSENTRETLILSYINCLMKAGQNFDDKTYPGKECATATGVKNWNSIEQCSNFSIDGSKALQKNGELTEAFQNPLKSVPTVTFRQMYDEEFQNEAMVNFRAAVCKRLTPSPVECQIPNSANQLFGTFILTFVLYAISSIF